MFVKRLAATVLAICLILTLPACGSKTTPTQSDNSTAQPPVSGGGATTSNFDDYDYYNWDYILCAALTHARTPFFQAFVDAVSERTDGHLNITLIGLGEHPYTTSEFISVVDQGLAEMGDPTASSNLGELPSIATVTLPFLIADNESLEKADTALYPIIKNELESKYNCLALGLCPETPQILAGVGSPLTDLASMANRKYRGQNSFGMEYIDSVGGFAVNVSYAEIASAMSTGVIQAFNSGVDSIASGALYDLCNWVSQYPMNYSHALIVVNKDAFDSLPVEFQQILTEEAANLESASWNGLDARCEDAYATIRESSCELLDYNPAFMEEAYQFALDAGLYDKWVNESGGDLLAGYNAVSEALYS